MKVSKQLNDLNNLILLRFNDINRWIECKIGNENWPIYHSLDLRISENKVVHVDSNLFPGGFHHLSSHGIEQSIAAFSSRLCHDSIQNIMIVIENFTRNTHYLNNVSTLKNIIQQATQGLVVIAMIDLEESLILNSELHGDLKVYPVQRDGDTIFINMENQKWIPDFILMNNDMTSGSPQILEGVRHKIAPALELGWHNRKKSDHFHIYQNLISELGNEFAIPIWSIRTLNDLCENINFREMQGLDLLKEKSQHLLSQISQEYSQHGIHDAPYLFLKADRGTFGMGIMEVHEPDEILNINKKNRHSLDKIKNGIANTEIFIQEGVRTIETLDDHPAETMIYSVNGDIVGEIIRYNQLKNNADSLNSKGMNFVAVKHFDINDNLGHIKWLINKIANLSCIKI